MGPQKLSFLHLLANGFSDWSGPGPGPGSPISQFYIPGCAFAAILIFFMKGSLVKGPNICPKMSIFIIYDPKSRVFDQKHTFGEIVMSKNMRMWFFQKKSPCGSIRQTKIAFKDISQYPRPNPDQIWYKNRYFYMKNHEKRGNSINIAKKK